MPFGVTNQERIQIAPIDAHSTCVTFNWFGLAWQAVPDVADI